MKDRHTIAAREKLLKTALRVSLFSLSIEGGILQAAGHTCRK
jgi:hypothetical protein